MISTSERRLYALLTLGLYVVLVGFVLFSPLLRPEGLPEPGITRLGATLGVWVGAVLLLEYWPVKKPGVRQAEPQAAEEAGARPTR